MRILEQSAAHKQKNLKVNKQAFFAELPVSGLGCERAAVSCVMAGADASSTSMVPTNSSPNVYREVVSALADFHGGKGWYEEAQALRMKLDHLKVGAPACLHVCLSHMLACLSHIRVTLADSVPPVRSCLLV